jgi:hypothetical protein
LNCSSDKNITQSTFPHKGCLPIPQLFGAHNLFCEWGNPYKLFCEWGNPYKEKIRRYATVAPDFQRKKAEMNLQLNFSTENIEHRAGQTAG